MDWLLPAGARLVADVGAGTGKLTGLLVTRGLAVVAVEPDSAMLDVLAHKFPQVQCEVAGAEQLPLADDSVDAVLVGQAWHWFDHPRALAEWGSPRLTDTWLAGPGGLSREGCRHGICREGKAA